MQGGAGTPSAATSVEHNGAHQQFEALKQGQLEARLLQRGAIREDRTGRASGSHVTHVLPLSRGWLTAGGDCALSCRRCASLAAPALGGHSLGGSVQAAGKQEQQGGALMTPGHP